LALLKLRVRAIAVEGVVEGGEMLLNRPACTVLRRRRLIVRIDDVERRMLIVVSFSASVANGAILRTILGTEEWGGSRN
jgi:hypothetical protein